MIRKKMKKFSGFLNVIAAFGLVIMAATVIAYVPYAKADTINVPADHLTIQAAIDAAGDGDVVIVAQDTYYENIRFKGKAITVMSVNPDDPDVVAATIIDGSASGPVVEFVDEEDSSPILSGFTIQNGSASGIYCYNSSPTIINCTINGNSAGAGGGIECSFFSSPTIINCIISGNSAALGGGIFCEILSSPTITNCTISENSASLGGGICCIIASPTITNCTISGNSAVSPDWGGGGIMCCLSWPTITNCTISGNSAEHGGGIFLIDNSSPTITNCTISGNMAENGAGIFCREYSSPSITNCILWNDSPDEICVQTSAPIVTYSDIQGGYGGDGNIDEDPLFIDAAEGNYRLSAGSPCIDAGTTGPEIPTHDKDGNPRDENPDMGAYESIGAPITVDIEKAKVSWDHHDIHVNGKLNFPEGIWMDTLSPVGSALITLAGVGIPEQSVDFEIKGKKDDKWEYKDKDNQYGNIKDFKIDWKGAKFDYHGADGFHIHTHFIAGTETTLCIHTGHVSDSFMVTINGTTIAYNEDRIITTDVVYEPQKDDNSHVHFTLPYQLTSDMIIVVSGAIEVTINVADYYTDGYAKFKLVSAFDPELFSDGSTTTPDSLEYVITLGDGINMISCSDLIGVDEKVWTKMDDKHWEYKE